jgi:hypothetical protein
LNLTVHPPAPKTDALTGHGFARDQRTQMIPGLLAQ